MIYLELKNVTTSLSRRVLIKNISFQLYKGEVVALVGHNGAGKSTVMKTIMNMLKKETGTIATLGKYDQDNELLEFKSTIAYLPEEPLLLTELTVMQHFQLYAMSYKLDEVLFEKRIAEYVKGFELETKLTSYPEELSKGMRQKVQIICSLLPDVPVLLIDEPFMGLDVFAIDYLLALLQEKTASGTSILLTTHQLERVRDLTDRFILLEAGEMIATGQSADFETITRGNLDG